MYKDTGGDTVQVTKTAEYLRRLGIEVDIKLCTESPAYADYDLLHFFNIIRPADILHHIQASGKPYVVSTIFVDYAEYEQKARGGIARLLFKCFSADQVEYLKVVARRLKNGEKIVSPGYLWRGHRRSLLYIARHAARLLPNSQSEYNRLAARYRLQQAPHSYTVVPNGIDANLFKRSHAQPLRNNKLVLCVGRIEGRKNQLNLIRALQDSGFTLYIIGSPSANQMAYFEECKKYEGPDLRFISAVSQQELVQYYTTAKVHVLPSWFETTGLSTLEAAAMGCNIVITDKGDTREYFEDFAWYCDPESPASIKAAIEQAAAAPVQEQLVEKIYTQYTWDAVAGKTRQVYAEVISK